MQGWEHEAKQVWLFLVILAIASCHPANALLQTSEDHLPASSSVELNALPLDAAERHTVETSLRKQDYADAERTLLQAASSHPRDSQIYNYLGKVFFLDRQYLNASISLKKAEALQPLNEKDRFTLAMAYVIMGHQGWAAPELEKLVAANPSDPVYIYWQGRLDYDRQDLFAAEAKFRRAIALDPGFVKAYDNLGLCLEGIAKFDAALEQYRQAVLLNRKQTKPSAWPALNLGSLLLKLDRIDEARAVLGEALTFDPNFEPAHVQLGMLLEKQNDHGSAVAELKKAAVLVPSDPQPHFVLARVYKHAGEMDQAKQELRTFRSLQPAAPRSRLE